MNYSQFERLVIGVGTAAVVGTILITLAATGWTDWLDLIPQVLLLPVLVVAVHGGRNSGLLAALVATVFLVLLRIPMLSSPAGATSRDLTVIVVSILAFGLAGIVGGEVCGRIKYVFARHDQSAIIDDWSRVYNQRRASELVDNARERHSRYGEPFSIIIISDMQTVLAGHRPSRQRDLVRTVANYVRGDVRMIDEVARLDDGRLLVVLPHTARNGGLIVTERLLDGVRQTLGAAENVLSARCLTAEDDLELASLAAVIARTDDA